MGMAETAQLAVRIDLEGNAAAGIGKLERQIGGLGKSAGRVGKGIGQIGAGIARAGTIVGAAAVTGLGAAAKAAIDFEDAFAGVRKTVDASDAELSELAKSFRTMATEIPIAATEFARIGELGGALGIPVDSLEEFTKTVALLGVTTDVAVDDAATSLGQLSNVLGLTGDDYDNFASTLVDLGNKGASTESAILEVTKRAGGAAKLIDIAADSTLGWSSAIANLGLQPELAGTALQSFFTQSLSLVNSKNGLEAMADIAGTSAKKFKRAFDKDASGALETFIAGLGKLSKDDRLEAVQDLFGKRSGLTRALLGLAESYDENLSPAIENAGKAWQENTALAEESRKRFETVRSSIELLKNNLIEAAITLGEGFAPAIGRAATKLAEFLRQDGNRSKLKALGEDIGKAIDDIDWDKVLRGAESFVGVLKTSLDITLRVLDALNKLPTELKAAAAGFLVLNKLSGGLVGAGIGNIAGGIGETIIRSLGTKLPGGVGKLFAQPVFVTNWPLGFGAGGPGGALGGVGKAGGIGAAVAGAGAGTIAFGAVALAAVSQAVADGANEVFRTDTNRDPGFQAPQMFNPIPAIQNLAAVLGVLDDTMNKPPPTPRTTASPNSSGSPSERGGRSGKDSREDGIAKTTAAVKELKRKNEMLIAGIKNVREAQNDTRKATIARLAEVKAGVGKTTLAAAETRRAASTGLSNVRSATSSGSASIVSAIYANRPITKVNVNVSATTVKKTVTVTELYGSTGGSRNTKHATGTGPLE